MKPAILYFTLAFAAGFALGTLRILVVVPSLGERAAELLETPFMIAVSYIAARFAVRVYSVPPQTSSRIRMGVIALALLLTVEFTVVLWMRGLTLAEYFRSRDPVSGAAYCLALVLFTAMPALVSRRQPPGQAD